MEIQYSSLLVGEGIQEGSTWFGGKLEVAIKKLDTNLVAAETPIVQRFLQKKLYEVKSLSHPNLVHVLDMVRNGDEAFLICEYVKDAIPLLTVLRDEEAELPWSLRVKVAQQVSEAVAYLHKRGVHHQNLKPSNILLVGKDYANVKVGDLVFWGSVAAQAFSSATFSKGPVTRTLSTANLKVGTTYTTWVAPEPLNRKAYMDDADVYAFGLVLYSLLTRSSPPARTEKDEFQFKDFEELKKKIPADAPVELWELTAKCIDANPKVRPTFERVTDALKALFTELTTEKKNKDEDEGKGKGKEKEKDEEKPQQEEAKKAEEEPKKNEKKTEEAKKKEKSNGKGEKKEEPKPKEEGTKQEKKKEKGKDKKEEEKTEEAKKKEKSNGKGAKKEEPKPNGTDEKKEKKEKEKKESKPKEEAKQEKKGEKKPTGKEEKPQKEEAKSTEKNEKKPAKEETKKGKKAKA